jgi:hypothetical protein
MKDLNSSTTLTELRRLIAVETSNLTIELNPRPSGDLFPGFRFLFKNQVDNWHNTLYVLSWLVKIVRWADPAWSPQEILLRLQIWSTHV